MKNSTICIFNFYLSILVWKIGINSQTQSFYTFLRNISFFINEEMNFIKYILCVCTCRSVYWFKLYKCNNAMTGVWKSESAILFKKEIWYILPPINFTVPSAPSNFLSETITVAPSRAKIRLVARPIPDPAPFKIWNTWFNWKVHIIFQSHAKLVYALIFKTNL